jgi:uncharacterized protein
MIRLIEDNRVALTELCVRYRVRRLELFGSATGVRFDPKRSDLDFLVEFADIPIGEEADHYFGLLNALEALFQRSVDLVMLSAVRNPYFLEEIRPSRAVLYAA